MTKTKLQTNSGKRQPYIYLDKLLIEEAFKWEKGQLLGIVYSLDIRRIAISDKGEPSRKLQNTSIGYPYVYLDKRMINRDFGWEKGQPLDIDYDVANGCVIISELNGAGERLCYSILSPASYIQRWIIRRSRIITEMS